MRIGLYGVSRSGKNFLIEYLTKHINQKQGKTLFHVNGSGALDAISKRLFSKFLKDTNEEQKEQLRLLFCDEIACLNNGFTSIIVDGHYSFPQNNGFKVVFTNKDRDLYDSFFYLDTPASKIIEYANKDSDKKDVAFMTEKEIEAWKNFEIDALRDVCQAQNKELIVLDNNIEDTLSFFENYLIGNTGIILDAEKIAQAIINEHKNIIDRYTDIILLDCDRTISNNDTTYYFCDFLGIDKSILKEIFAGERYSSYQFFRTAKLYAQNDSTLYDNASICAAGKAILNHSLIDDIKNNGSEYLSIGITSGILKTWETIRSNLGFPQIIVGGSNINTDRIIVSRAVKYQLARLLHAEKKHVIAVGDSAVDIDMLEEADKGFIVAQEKTSKNIVEYFKKTNSKIMQLAYSQYYYDYITIKEGIFMGITCLDTARYNEASALIAVCKSDSQQHGVKLRDAHYRLGSLFAEQIACNFSNQQITVVIMMRSGLCFGMGMADGLEYAGVKIQVLFHYDNEQWKKETSNCPHALSNTMFLVDAVINTGESIIMFSEQFTKSNRIIFVANVISKNGLKNFKNKEVYAIRISENSFTGSKSEIIINGRGPDTGDRLFNTR